MGSELEFRVRKCEELTPEEADALFFGGPGSKPHRANIYCGDCPFLRNCLEEAIELDLEGFIAGASQQQRRQMRAIHSIRTIPLVSFMPPEPDRDVRVVYLKVFTQPDAHEWMDKVEPTDEELLKLQAAI